MISVPRIGSVVSRRSQLLLAVLLSCLFGLPNLRAIDAQIFNGTSNQYFYVYYDTDSVEIGTAVNVRVVGSVDGDTYHAGGGYNRSWEGGSSNFSVNPNGAWGYGLGGETSIDRWITVTPNEAGDFFIGLVMFSYPNIEQAHAYVNFSAHPPSTQITSASSASRLQGQDASYQITATGSPSSFSLSGSVPNAAGVNSSSGWISGRLNSGGSYSSTIWALGGSGWVSAPLNWSIQAASIANTSSLSSTMITYGQRVNVVRAGSTNFTLGWTECVVWKPNGQPQVLSNGGYGTYSYTPSAGTGTYLFQTRVADVYGNYTDKWLTLYVADVTSISATTTGGQTYDARTTNPQLNFGQSVTVTSTVYDPSGTMDAEGINGDKGISGNWVEYATCETFSATTSRSFAVTYQPAAVGTGYHWMAVFGHDAYGYPGRGFNLIVNKATPTGTFTSRSRAPTAGYYTVVAGDLNATFANPYSGAVATPTGTITYRIAGTSTAVTPGTQLPNGVNQIEAVYPGDANYNATTVTATFTVTGPTTPTNYRATTTGSSFVAFSWNASSVPSPATLAGYNVYRNGTKLNGALVTGTTYTDSTAAAGTAYNYSVKAVDSNGNDSAAAQLSLTTAASFEVLTPLP